jgi:predicted component of type VI protein secretion system
MQKWNRALVAALTAITLIGCSSMQPLGESHPATQGSATPALPALPAVAVGQDVRLTLASGAQVEMQVLAVKADAIDGTQAGQPVSVELNQVRKIERRTWDMPRTAMLLFTAMVLAIVQPFGGSTVVLGLVP